MTTWKYSRKRLSELEARIAELDAETATPERITEWARLTNEADRCRMALWRRDRRRSQ